MQEPEIGIRIVRRSFYENDSRWNYPVNLYPFDTFYFVLGGDGFVKIGGTVTPLRPGYAYLLPARTVYSCWCKSSICKLYVEAHVEYAPGFDVFSSLGRAAERRVGCAEIRRLVRRNTSDPADALWFRGAFMQQVAAFLDTVRLPPAPPSPLWAPVLHRIGQQLSPRLSVEQLAADFGLPVSTLSHGFKAAVGCSPKQYIVRLLMSRLCEELITTDKTLLQLSEEFHFCDPYYLSAFFKKHQGVGPAEYRLQNRRP